jgi:hypothetical protein
MGKVRSEIDESARKFIAAQKIFFVASAPLGSTGHVNVSPKGLDTFRILGPSTVAYLDFNGSGVETIAHLKENGRIVLMFCAFQGPPDIYRLYGEMGGSSKRTRRSLRLCGRHSLSAGTTSAEMHGRLLWSRLRGCRIRAGTAFLFLNTKASGLSCRRGRGSGERKD